MPVFKINASRAQTHDFRVLWKWIWPLGLSVVFFHIFPSPLLWGWFGGFCTPNVNVQLFNFSQCPLSILIVDNGDLKTSNATLQCVGWITKTQVLLASLGEYFCKSHDGTADSNWWLLGERRPGYIHLRSTALYRWGWYPKKLLAGLIRAWLARAKTSVHF